MGNIIKAPFNFVPLNDNVFYPSWSKEISHDIPFEDSQSGAIELEMEALTPIYVRNGMDGSNQNVNNSEYLKFSHYDNRYFLPATSVKGMVRNVLEIMSFSKMPVDSRKKYAQRDWENPQLYVLKNVAVQNTIRCGWLMMDADETYCILDCDRPYRINHLRIDEYFRSQKREPFLEKTFCETSKLEITKNQSIGRESVDPKTARYKYELLGHENHYLLENVECEIDQDSSNKYQPRRVKTCEGGDIQGTIVFTGQPDKWKKDRKKGGKFYEFLFPTPTDERHKISKDEVEQFKFIYSDSEDWKFWRRKFEKGERIPVFFRFENDRVKDFGFALLYKLAYQNSVAQVVKGYQQPGGLDLAECIFGTVERGNGLKGRVQFGHAFATEGVRELPKAETVLGSPKASYYPLYIRQNGKNGVVANYLTYNDGVISGWKRYPVKNHATPRPMNSVNVDTAFVPLGKGVKFKCVVRYHNLRKAELGALLSAITFHGNQHQVFHNIGMAKPQGYGKLSVSCRLLGEAEGKEREMMAWFEDTMNGELGNGMSSVWISTPQIRELMTMGYDKHNVQADQLDYMRLEMKGDNDFIKARNLKEYLMRFTELAPGKINIPSIYDELKEELLAEERRIQALLDAKLAEERRVEEQRQREAEAALKRQEEEERQKKLSEKAKVGPTEIVGETDFKRGSGKLDTYVKKIGLAPEYYHLVEAFVMGCYENPKNKDKKKWEEPFANNHIFKKIISWVGEDLAHEWYSTIVEKK